MSHSTTPTAALLQPSDDKVQFHIVVVVVAPFCFFYVNLHLVSFHQQIYVLPRNNSSASLSGAAVDLDTRVNETMTSIFIHFHFFFFFWLSNS